MERHGKFQEAIENRALKLGRKKSLSQVVTYEESSELDGCQQVDRVSFRMKMDVSKQRE